jgi:hypothetical protein
MHCKELHPDVPPPDTRTSTINTTTGIEDESTATTAPVEPDLATDILAALCALGGELGGEAESIINGIAERQSMLVVRGVAMGTGASDHALLVALDDGIKMQTQAKTKTGT